MSPSCPRCSLSQRPKYGHPRWYPLKKGIPYFILQEFYVLVSGILLDSSTDLIEFLISESFVWNPVYRTSHSNIMQCETWDRRKLLEGYKASWRIPLGCNVLTKVIHGRLSGNTMHFLWSTINTPRVSWMLIWWPMTHNSSTAWLLQTLRFQIICQHVMWTSCHGSQLIPGWFIPTSRLVISLEISSSDTSCDLWTTDCPSYLT